MCLPARSCHIKLSFNHISSHIKAHKLLQLVWFVQNFKEWFFSKTFENLISELWVPVSASYFCWTHFNVKETIIKKGWKINCKNLEFINHFFFFFSSDCTPKTMDLYFINYRLGLSVLYLWHSSVISGRRSNRSWG